MKRAIKAMTATVAAALFLGAAGCSSGDSPGTDEQRPADNALSKIDPCAIIKPEKAVQAGLPGQGVPETSIDSQPGCAYLGDHAGIGIYRIADENLEEVGQRSVWSEFKPLKVNDREGAEAHKSGDAKDQCSTMVSTGGGVVSVDASAADPRKPFDACVESLKVAELIEPDLPK